MNVELGMCGLSEPSLYSVTGTTALTDSFGGTEQRRLSLTLTRVGLIGRRCSLIFSSGGTWDLGWALGGCGTRGSALSSCGLDLHDHILAAGCSAGKLGFDACKTCIGSLLLVSSHGGKLLLNLSIVGTGLLSRVSSLVCSST